MEKYYKQFEDCRQNERPLCEGACPFHVDILDFQAKMAKNRYNAAYKVLRNGVGFPDIVAALCPEYCAECCARSAMDGPVQINLLEKTCVAKTTKKEPNDYNLPERNKKAGVIGAGISGLACALRLSSKKYHVTIYEKSGRIGGQLWDIMPSGDFMADIERQLQFETYTLNLNTEILNLNELADEEFDAIYIATGKGGADFGAADSEECLMVGKTPVFAGGSLRGHDVVTSIADGLDMAKAIEASLRGAPPAYPKPPAPSKVVANQELFVKSDPVEPTDHGVFTDDEAAREAERCVRCQCNACMHYCDLSGFTGKWPLQMRDDIMTTTMSADSMIHKTPAIRLINMCTQCDLCGENCPSNIQLGKMLKEARKKLHKLDLMPSAYHQFWLRDMEFANGPDAALSKKAPDKNKCDYAFFPGCHLGAADPGYVIKPYRALLEENPETGLLLRCCGVPSGWAGNEEMHQKQIADLRKAWESLGKPTLIMACPSCMRHLREYLPEIGQVSLYEVLDQQDLEQNMASEEATYSVFDPCSARNMDAMQQAVRSLAHKSGVKLEELPDGDQHGCCGFGGHIEVANPKMAKYIAENRSELSDKPYLAYCINCRDIFRDEGKPVKHILDVLFNIDSGNRPLPTLTERRKNRVKLKEQLLNDIWSEKMDTKQEESGIKLGISPEIQVKMEKLRLLEEDLANVIKFGEETKRRTLDKSKGIYKSYREIGHITCWVEYRKKAEAYEIVNIYTHRMKIELEAVWNGRKTDLDLR